MESGGTAAATLGEHTADEHMADEPAMDQVAAGERAADEKPAKKAMPRAGRNRPAVGEPGAGQPAAAEQLVPEQLAAEQLVPEQLAAEQLVPEQPTPERLVPEQLAADRAAADRAAAEQNAGEPVAQAISRARRASRKVHSDAATEAQRQALVLDFFAQPVHDYVYQSLSRPVTVLRAGCVTPIAELGLDKLTQDGFEISVATVDVDHSRKPRTDYSFEPKPEIEIRGEVTVGDLRAIPLPPRSFDVVHCSLLLDRISHTQLVLDRFAAALRPGGLLLLRIRERDCAAGFLDRRLPGVVRRALWARLYPGQPGPFPAVYEPTASGRGITAYMLMRGLVITQRKTVRTLPHQPERLVRVLSATHSLIAWLSRGRVTDAHDEMLFVIRKPEDRFARVVLTPRRPGGVPARD
jgi:SAM-dependent methyltransferase